MLVQSRANRDGCCYGRKAGSILSALNILPTDVLANMFRCRHDFNDAHCAELAVDLTRELHPGPERFGQWLAGHAQRIPVPVVAVA